MKKFLMISVLLYIFSLGQTADYSKCIGQDLLKPPCCGKLSDGLQKAYRLKGGNRTTLVEFPWMVFIYSNRDTNKDGRGFVCAGSLIHKRWILTAAHCIHKGLRIHVRLGEWNVRTNPDCIGGICSPHVIKIRITKYFIHEKYNKVLNRNDIALLRLDIPITLSKFIHPICLPLVKPKKLTGKMAITAGWGRYRKHGLSNILLKASLNIWSSKKCGQYNSGVKTKSHLCAGGVKGIAICDGDSGGPLMTVLPNHYDNATNYQYLVGITSYSYGRCGRKGSPSIFTKVSPHIKWIAKKMKKYQ